VNSATRLWYALGLIMLACTLALLAGFGWAIRDNWFPAEGMTIPVSPAPPSATGGDWSAKPELVVVALGDSLTKGTGDTTGNGYVKGVVNGLQHAMNKPVRLLGNMAINGMRADQLAKSLDEQGYKNVLQQADIILISIGGNDLFQIASGGGSIAEGSAISPRQVHAILPEAEARLQSVFDKLRASNPVARIVYMGLYNPFYDLPSMRPASDDVLAWNDYAHHLAAADGNAVVVPTYDLFEANVQRYLSNDHFHPNADGYARIAVRIEQALE
jgi:lysophospholipase L1-like esterase